MIRVRMPKPCEPWKRCGPDGMWSRSICDERKVRAYEQKTKGRFPLDSGMDRKCNIIGRLWGHCDL